MEQGFRNCVLAIEKNCKSLGTEKAIEHCTRNLEGTLEGDIIAILFSCFLSVIVHNFHTPPITPVLLTAIRERQREWERDRERDRESGRETERERERERHTQRQREREGERDTERERGRQQDKERHF